MDEPLPLAAACEEVRGLRGELIARVEAESVPIDRVGGRVLAETVTARRDVPEADRATMDGYAYRADDGGPYELLPGETFPADDPPGLEPNQAVAIATGAALPERADTVVKVEDATVADGTLDDPGLAAGTYVYRRGSNLRAGEVLYGPGDRLDALDAILLRDLGRDDVTARRRFDVALLATGTEIHEGVHDDLDSPMLAGLLRGWGHRPRLEGSVPDEADRVRERIDALAEVADVVVTTGGTSVGGKDHVIDAIERLGEVRFHRVAIRPGKPIAVADLPARDAVAVAIPGKPIGAYVSATLVARGLFTGGTAPPTVPIELARDVGLGPAGFEYVVPVTVAGDRAMPLGHEDSPLSIYGDTFDPSVLSSSTRAATADGFVVTEEPLHAGETARMVPLGALE